MARFHTARIIICDLGAFRRGAAMALPGIGIIVGSGYRYDHNLLQHEYGHFLQAEKWGYFFFYCRVALSSLFSAWKRPRLHRYHWTEWTANYLSYHYFGKTADWDFSGFPIHPQDSPELTKSSYPAFCRNKEDFYSKYLDTNSSGKVS